MKKLIAMSVAAMLVFAVSLDVSAAKKEGEAAKKKPAPTPINEVCPMSGKAIDSSKTTKVTVKVCCKGCKRGATKNPGKVLAKVTELPNKSCPMKGKGVSDKSPAVSYTVGFCCGGCLTKFDKDQAANVSKVKVAAKKKKEGDKEKS